MIRQMKVYLAGPMRGIPGFNGEAFAKAAAALRELGFEVFSPHEESTKVFGTRVYENAQGSEDTLAQEVGMTEKELARKVFATDLAWICEHADAVALLPGWENSKGAKAERATAEALGLKLFYIEPKRERGGAGGRLNVL